MEVKIKVYIVTKVLSGIPADAEVFLSDTRAVRRRNEIESEIDEETDSVGIHEDVLRWTIFKPSEKIE